MTMGEASAKYEGSNDHIRQLFKDYAKTLLIESAHIIENINKISALIDFSQHNPNDESSHIIIKDIQKCSSTIKKHINQYMRSNFYEEWTKTYNFANWLSTMDLSICCLANNYGGSTSKANIAYENGDRYSGVLINGIKEGEGTLYEYSTGFTYAGFWKNDIKNGYGQYINEKAGIIYEGNWEGNLKSGNGKLYTPLYQYSGAFLKYKY